VELRGKLMSALGPIYYPGVAVLNLEQRVAVKSAKQIELVTGLYVAPNDVARERDFRHRKGERKLTWEEVIEGAHRLLVVGHDSNNGSYGPADISLCECWLSNSGVWTDWNQLTRIGIGGVSLVSTSHITYAAFFSREAMMAVGRPKNTAGDLIRRAGSLLHVSHRCHQDACINPRHLSIETPKVNLQRNNCVQTACLGHVGEKCILFAVDQNAVDASVTVKRRAMTFDDRMDLLKRIPRYVTHPAQVQLYDESDRIIRMIINPETRQYAVALFQAGENMVIDL
jgi:hypothetical protein